MEDVDQLTKAKKKAENVLNLANDNLEKAVLVNQDLEILEDKAQDFEAMAQGFEKKTKHIKNEKKWENRKWTLIVAAVFLLLFGYFFIL